MSARKPRQRAKERRRVLVVFLSLLIVFVAVFIFMSYRGPQNNQSAGNQMTAAIADQLSLTQPNASFVNTTTALLQQAGYNVTYYSGDKVTVDFYRNLPSLGYKIIIFRVHSGIASSYNELAFFTAQPYSTPNPFTEPTLYSDVWNNRLGSATYHDPPDQGETAYFAIRAAFIKQYGEYTNATIIVTGCYGTKYTTMAQAFIDKGAKVYIGWDGLQSADHADITTVTLLQHLVLDNQTVGQAVQNTMNETGTDPTYQNTRLSFYPTTSTNQTITQTITDTATTNEDTSTDNTLSATAFENHDRTLSPRSKT